MPIYKQWHPITPEFVSYVVDYFLDKQQHIRIERLWDAEIIHKWAVSTINRPLGAITLDPDPETEMYAVGTLYGYQQFGYEANTESDYPPKLLELVKDGAGFIDYCDKNNILTEIKVITDEGSTKGVSQICERAYLDYRKLGSLLKEEGAQGPWDLLPDRRQRQMLRMWHPDGENMMAGKVIDQIHDYPLGQKRKDLTKAFNQQIVRWRAKHGEGIVPRKRRSKSNS